MIGQAVQVATIADGTQINFIVEGGRLLRVGTDLATREDVTPGNVTIDPTARVYLTPFSNRLAVNDGVHTPWIADDLLASTVTATKIDYERDGSDWIAYGPLTVWDDSLFAVVRSRNGEGDDAGTPEKRLSRVAWSEPDDPTQGYHQQEDVPNDLQAFDNEWDIVQNGATAINALVGMNQALVYLRDQSIGYLTGATVADLRTTATHDAVDESTGTRAPASIAVFGDRIYFADVEGRVQVIKSNALTPIWQQHRRVVDAAQTRFPDVTARTACGVIVPELDLYLAALWSPEPLAANTVFPTTLYAFHAASGVYVGEWTIGPLDGDKVAVHAMGTLIGPNGEPRLVVLGKPSLADDDSPVGFYLLAALDENRWRDDDELPDILIKTHRIGFSANSILNADRAAVIVTTVPDPSIPEEDDSNVPRSISILPATFSLAPGATRQLAAVVRNPAGHVLTGVAITWASDNTAVATVSATGVVTAGATGGLARIHASVDGVNSNAATVQNTAAAADTTPASVTIVGVIPTLALHATEQLSAVVRNAAGVVLIGQAVSWRSDASTVLSISSTGVVTALLEGTANIRATASGIDSAPVAVTAVDLVPASIVVSPTSISLGIGASQQLSAVVKNASGVTLAGVAPSGWASSNTAVVTVSSTGLVQYVGPGSAVVAATLGAITSRDCVVNAFLGGGGRALDASIAGLIAGDLLLGGARLYDGVIPASIAHSALGSVLLSDFTFLSAPLEADLVGDTAIELSGTISTGDCYAAGTARWMRLVRQDGTVYADVPCGPTSSGSTCIVDDTTPALGQVITVLSLIFSV